MAPSHDFPEILRPADGEVPLVVSIPHSGVTLPEEELPFYAIAKQKLLQDGDLYVDELYEGAEALGATVVRTPFSRFVVDLNRLEDDFSPLAVAGARRSRAPGYYGDRGLFWAVTTHGAHIYRAPLSAEHVERRLAAYYRPYHAALSAELARLRERFGYAILLDAHSMPSRATKLHSDGPGSRRADIVPGDLLGHACGGWLSDATDAFWRSEGYSVERNQPYRGGGITRRHGAPDRGVHAIQVELNRGLYMDEQSYARSDGFEALRRSCLRFVERLSALAPPGRT